MREEGRVRVDPMAVTILYESQILEDEVGKIFRKMYV